MLIGSVDSQNFFLVLRNLYPSTAASWNQIMIKWYLSYNSVNNLIPLVIYHEDVKDIHVYLIVYY